MNERIQTSFGSVQRLIDLAWNFLPSTIAFLLILSIGFFIASRIRKIVIGICANADLDASLGKFLGSLGYWLILMIAGMFALSKFGVETAGLAAILASAGVAIGLALQGTLSNFAAGVMLLIFRPFKVGDYVIVAEKEGFVTDIELFSTTLDTLDNRHIIIPNGQVFGSVIENQSFHEVRRCDVNVSISDEEDIVRTREVLEKAASSVSSASTVKPHQVVLVEFGDDAMNWQVRTWATPSDYFAVLEETVQQVKLHLTEAGLEAPTPTMNIHT